jgi:foldase protein PrsA
MEMKNRLLFLPLILALVVSLAACGGGGSVPGDSVALVNGQKITLAQFNALFQQAVNQLKSAHQPAPTSGSTQWTQMRAQVLAYLVRVAELEQQAKKENLSVSQSDVTKYLDNVAKGHGGMKKFTEQLKAQGLTIPEARAEVYVTLVAQKIHDKITKGATVTTAEEQTYYQAHVAQYTVPETRNVAYILVKSKSLASSVLQKLHHGSTFAAMAQKYSIDKTTSGKGGKYTVTKGQVVPAFDAIAFSLKTGQTSGLVDATSTANQSFGWFIVQALGPVQKSHVGSFKAEQAAIHQTLLQQKTDGLWATWLSDLAKQYQGKVSYQAGYTPPTTTGISQSVTTVSTT